MSDARDQEEALGYSTELDKYGQPKDIRARILQRYEWMWKSGRLAALYHAVAYCGRELLPLPSWAVQGVLATIAMQYYGVGHGKRGRTAGHAARDRQNQIHWTRYCRVAALRDDWSDEEGSPLGDRPSASLSVAVTRVAEELQGTFAQGMPRAVERSYKLVKGLLRSGMECSIQPRVPPPHR
jgi:hypothetical protein